MLIIKSFWIRTLLLWHKHFWPGKTLMLGEIEAKRRRGQQRMRWLDSITGSIDTIFSKPKKIVEDRGAWSAIVHGVAKSWTQLSNLTTTTNTSIKCEKKGTLLLSDYSLQCQIIMANYFDSIFIESKLHKLA